MVVALVDDDPCERPAIALGPLAQQRGLAVAGGGDQDGQRRARILEPAHEPRPPDPLVEGGPASGPRAAGDRRVAQDVAWRDDCGRSDHSGSRHGGSIARRPGGRQGRVPPHSRWAATTRRGCTTHRVGPISPVPDDDAVAAGAYGRGPISEPRHMTSAHLTRLDTAAVSEEAFIFAYPLVLMDLTRNEMTSVPAPDQNTIRAPLNRLVHARGRQGAGALGCIGADTLISSAWLDSGRRAGGPLGARHPRAVLRHLDDRPVDERVRVDRSADDGHGRRGVRDRDRWRPRRAAARRRDADRRSHPLRADRRPDVREPRRVRRRRDRARLSASRRSAGGRLRTKRTRSRPARTTTARRQSGSTGWMPRRSSGWRPACSRTTRRTSRTAA